MQAVYKDNWLELVDFRLCDAAKPEERYVDNNGRDITHIYSYNKVMGKESMEGISSILNRTNWKILAWYFGPEASAKFGLKNFSILDRMPMHSTGKENFTVFIYYNTRKHSINKAKPVEIVNDKSESKDCVSPKSNRGTGKKRATGKNGQTPTKVKITAKNTSTEKKRGGKNSRK